MSIQKILLRLYPRTWRARYEEEFLVVLALRPFSFFEGCDIVRGALDAHLHPCLGTTGLSLDERMIHICATLRRAILTIFCAYIGFILAGWGLQKMTEYSEFQQAARAHSVIGLSFNLVVVGAVAALLAVLAGGLPIVCAVIRSAFVRRRPGSLFLLAVPVLAFAIFVATTLGLEAIDRPGAQPIWQIFLHRGLFFGTLILATIASTGALCLAVARSEIPARLLRFAVLPSILTTVSMALTLAATITWGLGLRANAPDLFGGNEGVVGTSTSGAWLHIVMLMAIATALALFSLMRGIAVRSALRKGAA